MIWILSVRPGVCSGFLQAGIAFAEQVLAPGGVVAEAAHGQDDAGASGGHSQLCHVLPMR